MIKLFIGVLVVAELAMLATHVPKGGVGGPSLFAGSAPVDAKWARTMARQAETAAREDARRSGRQKAVEACLGPRRESFSPTLYEARARACEARLDGTAREAKAEAPPPFEYPKPAPEPAPGGG
jgi:hypothetical protein